MTALPVPLSAPAETRLSPIAIAALRFAGVLALFSALTALMFWPLLAHLSTALLGPPEDNLQDFWNSFYAVQPHPDGFFFTHTIRHPEGTSLRYHSFAWPQVMAVWALAKLFGSQLQTLVALQNLTLLASFPLAGVGGFYLCRHLSGSAAGGVAGGFLFAFNPAHIAQAMHHAHVAGIEFLPFFVLFYLVALERNSIAWLAGASGFYVLSALSCWYYLFYIFYFLAFHLLHQRVRDHAWPRGWALIAPALCIAATLVLLSPLLRPMLASGADHGALRYFGGNMFVADLAAYFAFPPSHLLAPLTKGLYDALTGNPWEDTVYLGLVNLAVLAFAFWRAKDADRRTLFYALGGMVFFCVLASGAALHVAGQVTPIHMPDVVLAKLPFFSDVRTPARAIVFVYLFLGIVVAVAAAMALRRPSGAMRAGLVLAGVLMLLDFWPARLEATPLACDPALAVIAADHTGAFGVLDLPGGYENSNFYMAQQACHGRPIAQGEVARRLNISLADWLETRDLARQHRQLTGARIKYIVLHRPQGALFAWRPQDGAQARYRARYPVARDDGAMTVLRVY